MHSLSLRRAREQVVLDHLAAEQRGDWDAALATFQHPRYELTPTGEVHDGADEVLRFYRESAVAFPKLAFETRGIYQSDTAVIHEAVLEARHAGAWRGLPGTGRMVRYAMLNLFLFEEERLICERMYFDLLTPLRQVGVASDPLSVVGRVRMVVNHPLAVGRALLRQAFGRPSAARGYFGRV
jgi:steroid delta-isomerase-like uncharacterized protein